MKPILFVVALVGAAALVTSAVPQASQRAQRHGGATTAQVECGVACPTHDASACPGGCPLCSSKHSESAAMPSSPAR